MAIVNDYPTTIYIRDISVEEGKCFTIIKKQFKLNSNNEVVKTLFVKYLDLEREKNKLMEIINLW